jgi:hypothetical protein
MKSCYSAEPFVAKGFRRRLFFPHRVIVLRKAYPDTYLQLRKRGVAHLEGTRSRLWPPRFPWKRSVAPASRLKIRQLNLYSPWIEGFPPELFTDPAINWHTQQLGWPGLIASAGVFIDGDSLYVSILQSDLCQQVSKHSRLKRECATQLDKRFRYWYAILYNAILDFAAAQGLRYVYSPTGEQIVGTTRKQIDGALFLEIYNYCQSNYEVERIKVGSAEYWRVELARNADRIVRLEQDPSPPKIARPSRVICVFHDTEENVDSDVDPDRCHESFLRTLNIEREHGVATTYNLLGRIFARKAPLIAEQGSHSIAFHTYDHRLKSLNQLEQVRNVDLQVRGYRPAQSVITSELTDYALGLWNFEWLMAAVRRLGVHVPTLQNGIVKIPVHVDDYYLHSRQWTYETWVARLMEMVKESPFVAVGFHDCYYKCWLDRYSELIGQLKSVGELWTCDQITNHVYLADALGAGKCARVW